MNKKYIFASTLLISSVFAVSTFTGAASDVNLKEITSYINNSISIKLNGKLFIPLDTEGNKLNPIIYNGNSYLPVRSLNQALGVSVNYDETTNSIIIGQQEGKRVKLDGFRAGGYSTFVTSRDPDILSIHGETIKEGFYSLKPHDILPATANFRLNAKFQSLSFRVGIIGSPATIVLSDQKTKIEYKKILINETDKFKQVDISSIADVDYLDIQIYGSKDSKTESVTEKVVITDAFVK